MRKLKGMIVSDFRENTEENREKACATYFTFLKRNNLFSHLKLDISKLKHSGSSSSYKENVNDSHEFKYSLELVIAPLKGSNGGRGWAFDGDMIVDISDMRLEYVIPQKEFKIKLHTAMLDYMIDKPEDFVRRHGVNLIGHTKARAQTFERGARAFTMLAKQFKEWKGS